jgi:hypothetical protein
MISMSKATAASRLYVREAKGSRREIVLDWNGQGDGSPDDMGCRRQLLATIRTGSQKTYRRSTEASTSAA